MAESPQEAGTTIPMETTQRGQGGSLGTWSKLRQPDAFSYSLRRERNLCSGAGTYAGTPCLTNLPCTGIQKLLQGMLRTQPGGTRTGWEAQVQQSRV